MKATRLVTCVIVLVGVIAMNTRISLADGPKGTAVIKGKVVYEGTPPAPKGLPISGGDQKACLAGNNGKTPPDQGTIVYTKEGNTVPFVFVYVKNGISGKYDVPADPVVIDQKGCVYHPHVLGMMAGQGIDIKNSDPLNHNIHSLPKKGNPEFNFAQPQQNMVKNLRGNETFTKPEVLVKVKCDVHSWMSAYVGVLTHPFFSVSKSHEDTQKPEERGTFEIKNLPAGDYEIEAIHEAFGASAQKVTVKDGETKEIIFKVGTKKAEAPQFREVEVGSLASAVAKPACCKDHAENSK